MRACSTRRRSWSRLLVGYLLGEGVLEGVLRSRGTGGSRRGIRRPARGEAAVQGVFGQFGDGVQEGKGDLMANDGRRLQQPFLLWRQPVDAGRQDRLHRGRHLNGRERLRQAVGPRLAHQHPVSTRVRTLSSRKNGLPSVRSISRVLSGARLGSSPSRVCKSASALAGGSGSSRSCV